MQTIGITLKGVKPLLMHNEQLANPLSSAARKLAEVSKKRNKTLDDHRVLAEYEFEGGIYHRPDIGPYVPDRWILKMIQNGAKREKLGKAMVPALFLDQAELPIVYDGPKEIKKLYAAGFFDQRCIGVNQSKTVRTRPRFNEWALEFDLQFDETLVDAAQIRRALEHGGKVEGIGDYRPRFGTFIVERFDA